MFRPLQIAKTALAVSWHDVQMRLLREPMVILGSETLPADVIVCSAEETFETFSTAVGCSNAR